MDSESERSIELIFCTNLDKVKKVYNDKTLLHQAAKYSFDLVDSDKNGQISIDEFTIFLKEIEKKTYNGKNYLNKEKIERTFRDFDFNNSGSIEFNEFVEVFTDLIYANLLTLQAN